MSLAHFFIHLNTGNVLVLYVLLSSCCFNVLSSEHLSPHTLCVRLTFQRINCKAALNSGCFSDKLFLEGISGFIYAKYSVVLRLLARIIAHKRKPGQHSDRGWKPETAFYYVSTVHDNACDVQHCFRLVGSSIYRVAPEDTYWVCLFATHEQMNRGWRNWFLSQWKATPPLGFYFSVSW